MNEFTRTLDLIKKTQNNHLLFHLLHSHLFYIHRIQRHKIYDPPNFIDKIIVSSLDDPKIRKNSLETKILTHLKTNRKKSENNLFTLKTILYYLETRSLSNQNIFIIFEVVSNHYGMSEFTDALIDSVVSKNALMDFYGLKGKMLQSSAVENFLKEKQKFSCKTLPIYCKFDIMPPCIILEQKDPLKFRIAEALCFYLKYTKYPNYFKTIAPQTQDFIEFIKDFLAGSDTIFINEKVEFNEKNIKMESGDELGELLKKIKIMFKREEDKTLFKNRIFGMIDDLEIDE